MMTSAGSSGLERLIDRAQRGDDEARHDLLEQHRADLRRIVAARLDRRIAARVDASDIVQDALIDAWRNLEGYLVERPLPFGAWLRQLVGQRMIDARRRHLGARKRSVLREADDLRVREDSVVDPLARLLASDASPSSHMAREEVNAMIQKALAKLPERDRDVLIMRHVEQLKASEIAQNLGISEGAAKARLLRALLRLRTLMKSELPEES